MVNMRNASLLMLSGLMMGLTASANNMTISQVSLSPSGAGQAVIEFDSAWDNSWRDSTNFDACWHFIKYSLDGGTRWRHATLAASGTNPAGFSPGSQAGLDIIVPADKKGAFLQRVAEGDGIISSTNVQVIWDFTADGVSSNSQVMVKVLGLEMVYIPAGAFYVGDTNVGIPGNVFCFPVTEINTADMTQTNVTGAGSLVDPYLGAPLNSRPGRVTGVFNAAYPNGYNAFYMMKYELTEGQYVDFLNTLSMDQALNRYPDLAGIDRHTITGSFSSVSGSFTSAAPHRAVGFYYYQDSWMDGAAVVDWAALRPATEMEFEKACRGPAFPQHQEFPWGPTNALPFAFTNLTDDGTAFEIPVATNTPQANVNLSPSVPDGVIRVGAFASATSDRVKSGASYYGVMDLGGNAFERVVSSGNNGWAGLAQCPSYSGLHGDGELNVLGMADTAGWPQVGDYYSGRGGGWGGSNIDGSVRARRIQSYMYQRGYGGVRAARTAP